MEYVIGGAAFAAAVAVLYVLIRALTRGAFGRSRRLEAALGREALVRRRDAGEITQAEFDDATKVLGDG